MGIVPGPNQYGKAEIRLVAVDRGTSRHEIRDLTISTALRGDFAAAHRAGDNANVLPTDSQKNTAYAFAKRHPIGEVEDFALRLGKHFVDTREPVRGARILVAEHAWERIEVDGAGHDHAFRRGGAETRTAAITVDGDDAHVVSGVEGLVVLKSTGSEFHGFPRDEYTTLPETSDRILATAVSARWRHLGTEVAWSESFASVRAALLSAFATTHSLALQQTLHAMGEAVLEAHPGIAEVRLSLPNKHHFRVDLEPFGLDNDNEVFFAADRPYGLIEGIVTRDDVPEAPIAWYGLPEF
ncbi:MULTISPECIES: factor-independent urate hydroxylase [unclassified Saccharopolyspora]|uniref:factor-independent urate hydroxylase n=1 Tax=unclassified Saccharopolyspora TaxID=2646250 RepID=UPI001CD79697|nr:MULTISPECIES: urate oxidase [unclassified Saccharopolyspora]MCA1190068.1 urate oxidase [Saccharopolyspora sp. 6T]MCA1193231.1 urate oxidase [Saccharopolyspora sp. 6V]MCA1229467.1 urate oxidase [Saccharopolyspora sp. 6M]MCA1279648.1 urate oxidase [Saccharopolyspora sp. 7B]